MAWWKLVAALVVAYTMQWGYVMAVEVVDGGPGPQAGTAAAGAVKEVGGVADTSLVYAKCSAYQIPPGSPYWGHLGTTLYQLAENTAYADYDFSTQNGGANHPVLGRAMCNMGISPGDCCECLKHLSYHIWSICNDAISADVKFGDCSLRYEPVHVY